MQLNETIYRLRTQKGMSQGDLADALEVSRQSVSKWETGGATPDLDKLVKMSTLFGVTLDELVKGEAPIAEPQPQSQPEPQVIYVERAEPPTPRRKIAGYALFGLAILVVLLCTILGGMLAGVLFSLPFWACGAMCFLFQKRVGLWCSWTAFFLVDVYLRFATGISWGGIFSLIRSFAYAGRVQWFACVLMTILATALVICTVRSFRYKTLEPTRAAKARLAVLIVVLAVAFALPWAVSYSMQSLATDGQSLYRVARVSQVLGVFTQWIEVSALCRLAIDLLAMQRWKKAQQAE